MAGRYGLSGFLVSALLAVLFGTCLYMGGLAQGRYELARELQRTQQSANSPAPEPSYFQAQELETQREMARWALIQLIVSTCGVFLLLLTLNHTAVATEAATEAANEARRSNAGFADHSKRELRAYVGVAPPEPNESVLGTVLEIGKSVCLPILIKNTGQTPALNLVVAGSIFLTSRDWSGPSEKAPKDRSDAPKMVLFPGYRTRTIQKTNEPMQKPHADALATGDKLLFVFGEITYDDVFGDRHKTTFCLQYEGAVEVFNLANLKYSRFGNSAN